MSYLPPRNPTTNAQPAGGWDGGSFRDHARLADSHHGGRLRWLMLVAFATEIAVLGGIARLTLIAERRGPRL